MNDNDKETKELFARLVKKGTLKQKVYDHTFQALGMLKSTMKDLTAKYASLKDKQTRKVPFSYTDRGEFEAELKFAGDILIFMMHTNVFEFSRYHEVMKTPYVREDKDRSYCGIIHMYNFLADSFKYSRVNDVGYLVGRIFINKDFHYFIEGKREIGFLYNSFGDSVFTKEAAFEIIESAITYTINFDLLTPPYDNVKEVTLHEFQSALNTMQIKTGKRLGFRFQADTES